MVFICTITLKYHTMKVLKNSLLILPLLLIMAACSGSDDNESTNGNGNGNGNGNTTDKLVGTWKYIGDYYDDEYDYDWELEDCDRGILLIRANGTGKVTDRYCGEEDEVTNFDWENIGNSKYELSADGITETYTAIFFEDDDRLILDYEGMGGDIYERQ